MRSRYLNVTDGRDGRTDGRLAVAIGEFAYKRCRLKTKTKNPISSWILESSSVNRSPDTGRLRQKRFVEQTDFKLEVKDYKSDGW